MPSTTFSNVIFSSGKPNRERKLQDRVAGIEVFHSSNRMFSAKIKEMFLCVCMLMCSLLTDACNDKEHYIKIAFAQN